MPTNSENSFNSSRDSPDGGTILDPFIVLENHLDHFRSANIVEVDGGKIFCSICLEARCTQDVNKFEEDQYINYVKNIFNALDLFGETENIRKILMILLSIILPKRPVDPQRDDRFHKILRIFNKVMNSQLFNQAEFVLLVRILSNISIHLMQPIPLKSVWLIWKKLLDYSKATSVESLLGPEEKVTEKMNNFVQSQATIITTYTSLLIDVSSERYSHHIFTILHKHEPDILRKDHEMSQIECLKFVEENLTKNIPYFLRSESFNSLDRGTISEIFKAIHNCFELSQKQDHLTFLNWLETWDPISKVHSIIYRDPVFISEKSLSRFLHAYVKRQIQSLYGEDDLAWSMVDVDSLETRANKIEDITDMDGFCKAVIFYILLNRVALKTKSTYYKRGRVKTILNIDSTAMSLAREKLAKSKLLMRAHAYIMTKIHTDPVGHFAAKRFVRNSWQSMFEQKRLTDFREIYCHELDVFDWAHTRSEFCKFMDFETIDYITSKSLEQGLLHKTLCHFTNAPLRAIFASYLKSNSKSLFEKMVTFGIAKIGKFVLDEFAGWLPSLLHETILSYVNTDDVDSNKPQRCKRISSVITYINLLLSKSQDFEPHFDKYFVMDFVKLIEHLYKSIAISDEEKEVLIEAHELMALLIDSGNLCVMRLIQYMEFTLLGYMYYVLDVPYEKDDHLTEAIARVLVAYDELDYPLLRRINESLFTMPESACGWMMSQNTDLHRLSLIVMFKLFSTDEYSHLIQSHQNLSKRERLCLITAFLHMLVNNPDIIKQNESKIMEILRIEQIQFHPYYKYLLEESPELKKVMKAVPENRPVHFAPTPDITFDESDDNSSGNDSFGISRLLARLEGCEEDVGIISGVPNNIFLSGIIHNELTEFPGTDVWERNAHEASQSSFGTTQRTTQSR